MTEVSKLLEQVLNNLKDCRKFLKPTGTEELEDKLEMAILGVNLARYHLNYGYCCDKE